MRTAFTDLLGLDAPIVQASLGPWTSVELTAAVVAAVRAGRADELVPFAGQTVGLIDAIVSARDVINAVVAGAQTTLAFVSGAVQRG